MSDLIDLSFSSGRDLGALRLPFNLPDPQSLRNRLQFPFNKTGLPMPPAPATPTNADIFQPTALVPAAAPVEPVPKLQTTPEPTPSASHVSFFQRTRGWVKANPGKSVSILLAAVALTGGVVMLTRPASGAPSRTDAGQLNGLAGKRRRKAPRQTRRGRFSRQGPSNPSKTINV